MFVFTVRLRPLFAPKVGSADLSPAVSLRHRPSRPRFFPVAYLSIPASEPPC